ncbi:amino acid ABC transporter substrate-binding protein [Pseudomonas viridiflava]|uniref:Amino acid ABC transporter substrate-binding protein n=1 Tax=Pseudomonas viridiflava TaxID=33069 RepID=A0A1Y6JK94_PSEVI|nr:transporter substrate-binding domain-containing protein [Pseudomonas viridiflava]UZA69262.1 transporter substrate-binding domain-containing protein [Pseudomonas viridiflava]SMS10346.1 amino acid ABC transporter substrate-binding protein [Pseudomonas viridiflava]
MQNTTLSRFAASILGLALFAGVAHAAPTATPGTLKVGMEISYPPFESYDGDKVVGFDPDVSAALAKQLGGLKVEFVDTRFPNLILGLNANRFDTIISGMYITDERTKQAEAIPYAQVGAAIMVRSDNTTKPQQPEDLCGMKVGLQQGTNWINQLKAVSADHCAKQNKGEIAISEFPTTAEASQALMSGNIQAHLEISAAAQMIIDKARGRIVISSQKSLYPQTLGIYIKKGNTELAEQMRSAVDAWKKSSEYGEILKKYNLEPA